MSEIDLMFERMEQAEQKQEARRQHRAEQRKKATEEKQRKSNEEQEHRAELARLRTERKRETENICIELRKGITKGAKVEDLFLLACKGLSLQGDLLLYDLATKYMSKTQ